MPIEIEDCDGGIGVKLVFRGTVTDQEFLESLERHLTQDDDRFKKYRYSLNDLSAITEVNISNETIQQVAYLCEEAAEINPDPLVAYFADNDLVYGLSRMFETLVVNTNWETMVFIPIAINLFLYLVTLSAAKSLPHAKVIFHRKGFFVVSLLRMTGFANRNILLAFAIDQEMKQ